MADFDNRQKPGSSTKPAANTTIERLRPTTPNLGTDDEFNVAQLPPTDRALRYRRDTFGPEYEAVANGERVTVRVQPAEAPIMAAQVRPEDELRRVITGVTGLNNYFDAFRRTSLRADEALTGVKAGRDEYLKNAGHPGFRPTKA
jgi:hypothetical protein